MKRKVAPAELAGLAHLLANPNKNEWHNVVLPEPTEDTSSARWEDDGGAMLAYDRLQDDLAEDSRETGEWHNVVTNPVGTWQGNEPVGHDPWGSRPPRYTTEADTAFYASHKDNEAYFPKPVTPSLWENGNPPATLIKQWETGEPHGPHFARFMEEWANQNADVPVNLSQSSEPIAAFGAPKWYWELAFTVVLGLALLSLCCELAYGFADVL